MTTSQLTLLMAFLGFVAAASGSVFAGLSYREQVHAGNAQATLRGTGTEVTSEQWGPESDFHTTYRYGFEVVVVNTGGLDVTEDAFKVRVEYGGEVLSLPAEFVGDQYQASVGPVSVSVGDSGATGSRVVPANGIAVLPVALNISFDNAVYVASNPSRTEPIRLTFIVHFVDGEEVQTQPLDLWLSPAQGDTALPEIP